MTVNSYTSWQPLEEVIVGSAYPADYFDFIDSAQVRNQLQLILHETEEDLDNLAKLIEQHGAARVGHGGGNDHVVPGSILRRF